MAVDEELGMPLTELIQKLSDRIRTQEVQLKEHDHRMRASKISFFTGLCLCLVTILIGTSAPYVAYLWLALSLGAALVARISHNRCDLLKILIGDNKFFRSIVVEEAYTGKEIGSES